MGNILEILIDVLSTINSDLAEGKNSSNKNISEDNLKLFLKKFDSLSLASSDQMSKKMFRNYWTREDEFSEKQIDTVVSILIF
jgi:hypothetical protein